MNPDALETLLIDRALGRHSPEVEVLLAEHLATDPQAAKLAAELEDMVALATKALVRAAPELTPPPRIEGRFWFHRANRVLALAASFAMGAALTLVVARTTGPRAEPVSAQQVAAPPALPTVAKAAPPAEIAKAARALP